MITLCCMSRDKSKQLGGNHLYLQPYIGHGIVFLHANARLLITQGNVNHGSLEICTCSYFFGQGNEECKVAN
jgi:hypothetical protein